MNRFTNKEKMLMAALLGFAIYFWFYYNWFENLEQSKVYLTLYGLSIIISIYSMINEDLTETKEMYAKSPISALFSFGQFMSVTATIAIVFAPVFLAARVVGILLDKKDGL